VGLAAPVELGQGMATVSYRTVATTVVTEVEMVLTDELGTQTAGAEVVARAVVTGFTEVSIALDDETGATVFLLVAGGEVAARVLLLHTLLLEVVGTSVAVTGQMVVETATVSVTTSVEWAGQLVTVAAHEVTVRRVVVKMVEVVTG